MCHVMKLTTLRANLLSLYLSVKRSHHIRREGLENSHVNPKKKRLYTVGFYEDLKV
jgi:hypothetical protein